GINKGDDPLQLREQGFTDGKRNRWYYEMQELGFNYRLTEIQAVLGSSQLRKLERFLERRRTLVAQYDLALRGNDRVRPAQSMGRDSSGHHLYVVRARFGKDCPSRNEVMQRLYE